VRSALELKLNDGPNAKTFREHPTFSPWNGDGEFVALYHQFEPKELERTGP
jgi:hypothetical protein